ncbi:MAG: hypothetical protein ABIH63_00790 [archaeon]
MRRGQMEILGLVVIVVLFIFGGLIYIFFMSRPADTSMPETRQSAEVSNLLNTMMKVTPCTDKPSDTLEDIIQNCYLFSGNSDYCGNPSCKSYVNEVVGNVTKAYNRNWLYYFEINQSNKVFISQGSCNLPDKMFANTIVKFGKTSLPVTFVVCEPKTI